MSVGEFFTITPGATPNTLVVQGTVGRYTDMRTTWLEETPGHFVALDTAGHPITYQFNASRRVLVEQDGINWAMGMYATSATQFAGTTRDEALARATVELHS